jgi:cysteinyl-tRNA synthetase
MTAQLRLYNTLSRQKEPFTPLDPARVRMYVCGPTVYDFAHIGNARPVIVFDVLFRLLRHLYGAENVIYTRNITDVDDKINDRAARDYPGLPLNEAIREVTEATNAQFQADVKALGCLEPTHQPRATEHIEGMLRVTQRLLDKGFAYVAEGTEGKEVLFAVTSMPRYGQLSNRRLEEQEAGARVAVEAHKRNPGDFVLWKQSSAGQPGWTASFTVAGKPVPIFGRPGWHIECSAMSMATLLEPFGGGLSCDDPLKNTFDIHGGGIDLVFPHHENEIAQSCCAFGSEKMAQIWMHNGFLQVEGQKMSKSLGNFVTINELLATEKFGGRKWDGQVLRLAMLKTHYRQPIDWTVSALLEAENKLDLWHANLWFESINIDGKEVKKEGGQKYLEKMIEVLSEELNTWEALRVVDEAFKSNVAPEVISKMLWLLGVEPQGYGQRRSDENAALLSAAMSGIDKMAVNSLISQRATPPGSPRTGPNLIASAKNFSPWASSSRTGKMKPVTR